MATRRTSSSSTYTSELEETSTGALGGSVSTENLQRSAALQRNASSTASQISAIATGTPYDALSIATTNTGFTNATNITANTSVSQQQPAVLGGNIPIIRPPTFDQLSTTNTITTNQPIRVNVASAHQQYQQQTVLPQISPYSGSSTSSAGGSLSSPGTASLQQQRQFDVSKAVFTQVDTNRDGFISKDEFRQWAQNANPTAASGVSSQYHQQFQQSQFANQFSAQQQALNNLQSASVPADSTLLFDYGVIEAYNIGLQSAGDITAEQASGNFDMAKAIFKQVDTNQDGAISRDEFRQWAQNATPNPRAQASSFGNSFRQGALFAGATPDVANILQQSGLGQAYGAY